MVRANGSNCSRNETVGREQMIFICILMFIICFPMALLLLDRPCNDNKEKENLPKSYRLLKSRRHR